MAKLKLALYWAAGCGGCDVSVLDLHERILDVAKVADLVFWPIALDTKYADVEAMADASIDVALVNGAVRNRENEHLALLLRRKAKLLVAFGSCAHLGGIPGLANLFERRDVLAHVYRGTVSTDNDAGTLPEERLATRAGELTLPAMLPTVRTLSQVVPVDYTLPGCPPAVENVWAAIQAIASGTLPPPGTVLGAKDGVALCDECTRKKGEKRVKAFRSLATFTPDPEVCLLEQGVICCGPATRAGCGGQCLRANVPCRGCYGAPDGVVDQGGKLLSAVASVIDAEDEAEIERIVDTIADPAGTFYRFSLPASLLGARQRKEVA